MNRPLNILFLMADQLAPHFLSAYGHKVVKTPRLDDIATDSTIFDAHYSNSPLCARQGRVADRAIAIDSRCVRQRL